ncbi:MAG: stage IV sporulation protein A [Erysipelotrichaceae bacterium]|nr:stage IV sporulation protein A [Erysipelotrichaceae bacterium]
MNTLELLKNIGTRTNSDIYVGVVGPVRVGKSTFIRRFMELVVLDNITNEEERKRATDELPQAGNGKQIMTCEPKFVPNNAASVKVDEDLYVNIRFIDCVGYVFDEALGHKDGEKMRMVKTPWFDEAIEFDEAAKIGTNKVIKDHSTIGIVVTTDGSIVDLPRQSYIKAEEEVIMALKEIDKPFIVVVNSKDPTSEEALKVKQEIEEKYQVTALVMSAEKISQEDARNVLQTALYEFPVTDIEVMTPSWISVLSDDNALKMSFKNTISEAIKKCKKVKDVKKIVEHIQTNENIKSAAISNVDTGTGLVTITIEAQDGLYEQTINQILKEPINDKADLIKILQEYRQYTDNFATILPTLEQVKESGYGVVYPTINDITLSSPELIKQNNRYGIQIKANAPAIHLFKVDIEDAFEPILGSKQQAEAMIDFLKSNPENIKTLNMFGRPLIEMLNDGINSKLQGLPDNLKTKLQKALNIASSKQKSNIIVFVF